MPNVMQEIPFSGQSYRYGGLSFDAQRSVNVFPVLSQSGTSKSKIALQGRPGLQVFLELPESPIRGMISVNDRNFAVGGNTLYEIFIDGTYVSRGTLNSQSGTVGMAQNGFQICTVDGPDGYIFTLDTNVFTEITDPYFLGANSVAFDSGYFIFVKPDSQIYYISALYDGTTGDPLDFAAAEGSPDNLLAVASVHQQVALLGVSTTQWVTNTGEADFPYSTVPGALMQYGIVGPYAFVVTANNLTWVGQDGDGNATVWRAEGYSPTKISTAAIDTILQNYSNLSGITMLSYQEQGHYFVGVNIPEGQTCVYVNSATNEWHERAYFSDGEYSRHRPNFHLFSYNKHLVSDYENGKIYQQSIDLYTDAGVYIRVTRSLPYLLDNLELMYCNMFQLNMLTGIGLDGGSTIDGGAFDSGFDMGFDTGGDTDPDLDPATRPRIVLDWSDDGGHTWSNYRYMSAGRLGQYGIRAITRRLGRFRQRIFRVTMSVPCKIFWNSAYLGVEKGYA